MRVSVVIMLGVSGMGIPGYAAQADSGANGTFPAFINPDKYLTFALPSGATADQKALAAEIMALDHRAHEQLGPDTPEWKEVLGMLTNAANIGLMYGEVPQARLDYNQAEQAFFRYLQAKNRLKYLLGLMIGVVVCTLLSGLLYALARSLAQPFVTPKLLPLLCLFAGMGSLTSVLTGWIALT